MEIIGKLKVIKETEDVGSSGFQKRECVVITDEQYPQDIMVQFVQDKCNLLSSFKVGENVRIDINLRGREWVNPQGIAVYFNTIQGWKITSLQPTHQHQGTATPSTPSQAYNAKQPNVPVGKENEPDDLPF